MFGLPGPALTDEDVRLFEDTRAGALILYRRNFESPAALLRLLESLEARLGRRLLVATDHEGGRVVMLGEGTTIFPDNLAMGTAGEEAFAYGKDPRLVSRYGTARIKGMARGGLSACVKHFPGKGHSPLDAHLSLPVIESTWAEMHAVHLPPFLEAIAAGFKCVILSDALEMGAIAESCPTGEAAVKAAAAGHDLLLVCHTERAQRAAAAALLEACRRGVLSRGGLEAAA